MERNLTPVDVVATKIADGKDSRLAQMLGVARSTISCWRSVERRGPGLAGTIPLKHHVAILKLSDQVGAGLTPGDLVRASGSRG